MNIEDRTKINEQLSKNVMTIPQAIEKATRYTNNSILVAYTHKTEARRMKVYQDANGHYVKASKGGNRKDYIVDFKITMESPLIIRFYTKDSMRS